MKRHLALIIALFHVIGSVGLPVVAYNCVDSGEEGLAAYLEGSSRVCYAESCCDGDEEPATVLVRSEIPCCDLDIHTAPENSRILLPGHKYGQDGQLADTPARYDDSRPGVHIDSAHPAVLVFHASINLPLLV